MTTVNFVGAANVAAYELDNKIYCVTSAQNTTVEKFEGEAKEKLIRRTAYAVIAPGDPIPNPYGAGSIPSIGMQDSAEASMKEKPDLKKTPRSKDKDED